MRSFILLPQSDVDTSGATAAASFVLVAARPRQPIQDSGKWVGLKSVAMKWVCLLNVDPRSGKYFVLKDETILARLRTDALFN
jgi:hypothetical protein